MNHNMKEKLCRASDEGVRTFLRDAGGILNINKPAGMTSHDVVGKMRRILGFKKIGHTGTLDPMATGVLPICIGRGTRIIEYLDMDQKTYVCRMLLGRAYDTQDITGEIMEEVSEDAVNRITEEDVRAAFADFHGVVEQFPPMYSAIKIDGKKLYEYARAGRIEEIRDRIKIRRIHIADLTILSMDLNRGYASEVCFSVTCSRGTYVRSICEDAGRKLGVLAAMSELTRTASGDFVLEGAWELAEIEQLSIQEIAGKMMLPQEVLSEYGELELGGMDMFRITNGMPVWVSHVNVLREPRYAGEDYPLPIRDELRRTYLAYEKGTREFLGIVTMDIDRENIRADKMFYRGGMESADL